MQNDWNVLITDYVWPSIEPERQVLAHIGAELIAAETGDEAELLTLVSAMDGILTCWKPVREPVIAAAERCQVIGRCGIGLDNIDVAAATAYGIVVTNVPAYCIHEVSDHAMGLLLACARKISRFDRAVKAGTWDQNIGPAMRRLRGKTVGIIGFGRIARAVVPKAAAFGLTVNVCSPRTDPDLIQQHGAQKVSFSELLATADFITIHAPLTQETHHLFGAAAFRAMKSTAYLINTARGGIVDTAALTAALRTAEIAGAAVDVLETEPPEPNAELLALENVIVTPHAAFMSEESILDLEVDAATSVAQVLTGQRPDSIVNPDVLEQPNLRAKSLANEKG